MPPQLAGWAATLDLSRLPDDVALRAREVLSQGQPPCDAGAREELGAAMVAAVAEGRRPIHRPAHPAGPSSRPCWPSATAAT